MKTAADINKGIAFVKQIKCLTLLLMLIVTSGNIQGQFNPANQKKYEDYRTRFNQYYIVVGPDKGESIPFSTRRYKYKVHELRCGESTFMLGSYIATLAMEYERYKTSRDDLEAVKKELFYALNAINRLDYYAETYDQSGTYPAQLNGFFVREDFPEGFLKKHRDHLNAELQSFDKSEYYKKGSAKVRPVSRNKEETKPENPDLPHRNMSHDHGVRLMWGLNMVYQFVNEDAQFGKEKFLDGESSIKQEAKNIILRMIGFFDQNRWRIVRPNGEFVNRGYQVYIFKKELKRLRRGLLEDNKQSSLNRMNLAYGLFNKGVMGVRNRNAWMNGRMQLETQNLSGNAFRAWQRSFDFGYEPYFVSYGILVHNWKLSEKRNKELKKIMEFYLNTAPCEGNYYHDENDFSSFGWATPDRTERALQDTYFGIFERGNYSGLDFLLMYNLYALLYPESMDTKTNKIQNPCQKNCAYINQKIKNQEIGRATLRMNKSEKETYKKQIEKLENLCRQTR